MKFSTFFFSSEANQSGYDFIFEVARFADREDFHAIWVPERHFHPFGGLYPNPALLAASLAMITKKIRIRAGSVVLPLHHPIRVAEEWSMVDNLSAGRADIAFTAGWHPDDFVFNPANYADRKSVFNQYIDTFLKLWTGEEVSFDNGANKQIKIRTYPQPVQSKPNIWITSVSNPATWEMAGKMGFNILTGLLELTVENLKDFIQIYRKAYVESGHDINNSQVTVMLHTYIDHEMNKIHEVVKGPLLNYLESHIALFLKNMQHGGMKNTLDVSHLTKKDKDFLLQMAYDRYVNRQSLIGTLTKCQDMVSKLAQNGVDEIACLIDFNVPLAETMKSLEKLAELKNSVQPIAV